MENIKSLNKYFSEISEWAKRYKIPEIFNWGIFVLILYWLTNQILDAGISNVLQNLPTSPFYYILFVAFWFSLPLSEWWIYRFFWHHSFKDSIMIYIHKKVFNSVVVQYSGEIVLFVWVRKVLGFTKKEIFSVIKDNNIISSISSTILAILMFIFIFLSGYLEPFIPIEMSADLWMYIGLGSIGSVIAMFLLRKKIFGIGWKMGLSIFGVHSLRFFMMHVVNVLKWYFALPHVPLSAWFVIISISLVVNRLPFIPNRDLLVLGGAIEVGVFLGLDQAEFTGLFLTEGILTKGFTLFMYGLSSQWMKKQSFDLDKEKALLESENQDESSN